MVPLPAGEVSADGWWDDAPVSAALLGSCQESSGFDGDCRGSGEGPGVIFAGVDWAEAHHDVHVQDEQGRRLAGGRLPDGIEGIARFHEMVAAHAGDAGEVVIGIETDRGLFAGALVAAGYQVFAVNPLSVSRYRDRHSVSGAKSDPADAKVLADLVRTDRHNHRRVIPDTDLAEAVKVLARAHQSMIWNRRRQLNQLRSALREFYPAALAAFDDLASADAIEVLKVAPEPRLGAALSKTQIGAALRRGGRTRRIDQWTAQIQAALRAPQLQPPPVIAAAMGAAVAAQASVTGEMSRQIAVLEQQLAADFEQHPDAEVVRSLPGLGTILSARVLGEFGDVPDRYANAKSRRNYAGTSPVTRASGTRRVVLARHVRNRRLADAIYLWAFSALSISPGARVFYDQRRAAGDTHHQALRALGNHLVGFLHGCLTKHTVYDEQTAWAHRPRPELKTAA
jgi:transposase